MRPSAKGGGRLIKCGHLRTGGGKGVFFCGRPLWTTPKGQTHTSKFQDVTRLHKICFTWHFSPLEYDAPFEREMHPLYKNTKIIILPPSKLNLWTNNYGIPAVPRTWTVHMGPRSFTVSSPTLWNSLN